MHGLRVGISSSLFSTRPKVLTSLRVCRKASLVSLDELQFARHMEDRSRRRHVLHPAARFGLASASSYANPYCCGKASSDALILRYLFFFFIAALGSTNAFVYLTFFV